MSPIGWGCITSTKYEQFANVLRQGFTANTPIVRPPSDNTTPHGEYVMQQHPLTGEMIRVWVPAVEDTGLPDDPETPDVNESQDVIRIPCQARAIITGGINVQGTAERWTSKGTYENVDFIKMQVPPQYIITKRDRITNVTDSRGNYIWLEEEYGRFTPTVFDVRGVSPSLDPFGSLIEWVVLLERSELQTGTEKRGSNG